MALTLPSCPSGHSLASSSPPRPRVLRLWVRSLTPGRSPLGSLPRHVAQHQLFGHWPPPDMLDEELHRAACVPFALVAFRYHEASKVVFGFLWVVLEHEQAHRRLLGVDSPEPSLLAEIGFRDGDGVGGHEALLARCYGEVANIPNRLGAHLAQTNLGLDVGRR